MPDITRRPSTPYRFRPPTEVYPLLTVLGVALCYGTYAMATKLRYTLHVRNHEESSFNKATKAPYRNA